MARHPDTLSPKAKAEALAMGGVVRASLGSGSVAAPSSADPLASLNGTPKPPAASIPFDSAENKPRTAGHVLAEILGQQIAIKRAEKLIASDSESADAKAVKEQLEKDKSALDIRRDELVAELGTLLAASGNEHDIETGKSIARQLADKAKEPVAASPDGNLKDMYKSLVTASGFPPQPEKNKLALTASSEEEIDHYDKLVKERTENLAKMLHYMGGAKEGTFTNLLGGLTAHLDGPPAQVKVNSVRNAVLEHMRGHGYSPEAGFATAVLAERASQPNLFTQGAVALFIGGGIVIPDFITSAWKNGTKIDVTSGEWQTFKKSLGEAGEGLTGDINQIMSKAYTEVGASQRNEQCMQVWHKLINLKHHHEAMFKDKTPLTAEEKAAMPQALRKRFVDLGREPTLGDMAQIAAQAGAHKEATALTGSYAQADAQKGLRPFNRSTIASTVRGALGMPPDGSTITASMEKYISSDGAQAAAEYTKGQGGPPMKMGMLGNSKPVDNRDYDAELLTPARRYAENPGALTPTYRGVNGIKDILGIS